MATLNPKSREEIVGDFIRTVEANTDITDVSEGSSIATLGEAIGDVAFEIQLGALKILESTDDDSLSDNDLDRKAESIRLPNGIGGYGRKPANQASDKVRIGSSFAKVSSKLYAGKPAPYAGATSLFLENASAFNPTGQIFIGRNTVDRFEGPISYTSLTNTGTHWVMVLSSPITKPHLASDLVVMAQGGDRTIPAGVTVQVPASSQRPAVSFTTTETVVIPDGEAEADVSVVCTQFGEIGNVLAGAIKQFSSAPFAGATVTNLTSFQSGQNTESSEDLRQRIKQHPSTLSRGTDTAILAAIQGAVDPDTGRTIQSSIALAPIEAGDSARIYIDDNTGLEPTFDVQPYELLLGAATGQETRFRASKYPVVAAAIEGSEVGPYTLQSTWTLTVTVDEVTETYSINSSNYKNLNAATAYEVVRDLNSQSNIVGFRTIDGGTRIVMIDLSGQSETMSVQAGDLQAALGLPLATIRPVFLYVDGNIQSFRGITATLTTRPRNQWSISLSDLQNIRVVVDGVTVEFIITNTDFAPYGTTITSATVTQWAEVFAKKIPGVKFTVSGQQLVWTTRNQFSPTGTLEILETRADGTPAGWVGDTKIWTTVSSGGELSAVGAEKNFSFNRFTGEIELVEKPTEGARIELGSKTTRARIVSGEATGGIFALSELVLTFGTPKLVVGFDGDFVLRTVSIPTSATMTPTHPDPTGATNLIRLTANSTMFANAVPGDYLYLAADVSQVTWDPEVSTLYVIKKTGNNQYASNQTHLGLAGSTIGYTSVTANTTLGSSRVVITLADHGLRTGDLITVFSQVSAIGGISAVNLQQTNTPVLVIDQDHFSYTAGAAATATISGTINNFATNLIDVTDTAHGFSSGGVINVTASSAIGGISAGNLSVSGATIEQIDTDTYRYRAAAAATSTASGTINQVVYVADTWIEIEVSDLMSHWTALLTIAQPVVEGMVHVFSSKGSVPQIVDFGNSFGTATVDDVVSAINSQVAGGQAVKENAQQVSIRSNRFVDGTVAVFAAIGTAEQLFSPAAANSIQAHRANRNSSNTAAGAPIITDVVVPSTNLPTRTYLELDRTIQHITSDAVNPTTEVDFTADYPVGFGHLFATGRQHHLVARTYNNQPTAPFQGIVIGDQAVKTIGTETSDQTSPATLDRYYGMGLRFGDLQMTENDKLVVEMDLDATDKTVSVQMHKLAKILDIDAITGSGAGQVITFSLKDPEDSDKDFFDPTSVYKDFDFVDFALLTRAVGLYRESMIVDRGVVVRSVAFGAPNQMALQVRYPVLADQPDIQVSHINTMENGVARQTILVYLASDVLVAGSAMSSGAYQVDSTPSGVLFDWRITGGLLNPSSTITAGDLLNIGAGPLAGSYKITSANYANYTGVTANVTNLSATVTVTQAAHGFLDGDLVSVSTTTAIGGISAANLSGDFVINVTGLNTFEYTAGAAATSTVGGTLDSVASGAVEVVSPTDVATTTYNAATAPIASWPLLDKTWTDVADALNGYLPESPLVIAAAFGTNILTNPVVTATFEDHSAGTAYAGSSIEGGLNHHTFLFKMAGRAGIWQYDSSVPATKGIKATVQASDSIWPTTAEALGTSYSPINEEVVIVPTNSKTAAAWLNFNAVSSLNILADIDRTSADREIQLSSVTDGSLGAVQITGVAANELSMAMQGNATESSDSTVAPLLNAESKALIKHGMVKVKNSLSTEILRSYRSAPVGSAITLHNTIDQTSYFNPTTAVKYIRVNSTTGRLIFFRYGMGSGQVEPLQAGNDITTTSLGNGLVQVTSAIGAGPLGSGKLAARQGDQMYCLPGSPLHSSLWCAEAPETGKTDPSAPDYRGYPVVRVIDDSNIVVLAPNVTSFGTVALTGTTELVFMPAIFNEKNIKSTYAAGPKFHLLENVVNSGNFYVLVKKLGSELVGLWIKNSSTEATDTMDLANLSVSTDDWAVLGTGFAVANQGQHRIVAHNGRNFLMLHIPSGGVDEVFDTSTNWSEGGKGSDVWTIPVAHEGSRPIRIIDADSVRIGDQLRISTAATTGQWFPPQMIGSFPITGIGYSAFDYTGALPHQDGVGTPDSSKLCPFIEFTIANAPTAVTDTLGAPVDNFLLGDNNVSIGFVEQEPIEVIRQVVGHGVSAVNSELSDVFLVPRRQTNKMSDIFGTYVEAMHKLGYSAQTNQGIDGYKVYAGLVREAHRIIDGLPTNTILFPGVKASGTFVEVLPPLVKAIQITLQVRPKDGVTLNSISEVVKATVASYVNGLGVGKPVVLSEIISVVQRLPGVFSVKILDSLPVASDDRIVVAAQEKPFILDVNRDIVIG